jgi:glycine oxidase
MMANGPANVVIVGGGIARMATAYYLATCGVRSAVVERDAIGSHASGFAYGGLMPLSGIPGPEAYLAVCLALASRLVADAPLVSRNRCSKLRSLR